MNLTVNTGGLATYEFDAENKQVLIYPTSGSKITKYTFKWRWFDDVQDAWSWQDEQWSEHTSNTTSFSIKNNRFYFTVNGVYPDDKGHGDYIITLQGDKDLPSLPINIIDQGNAEIPLRCGSYSSLHFLIEPKNDLKITRITYSTDGTNFDKTYSYNYADDRSLHWSFDYDKIPAALNVYVEHYIWKIKPYWIGTVTENNESCIGEWTQTFEKIEQYHNENSFSRYGTEVFKMDLISQFKFSNAQRNQYDIRNKGEFAWFNINSPMSADDFIYVDVCEYAGIPKLPYVELSSISIDNTTKVSMKHCGKFIAYDSSGKSGHDFFVFETKNNKLVVNDGDFPQKSYIELYPVYEYGLKYLNFYCDPEKTTFDPPESNAMTLTLKNSLDTIYNSWYKNNASYYADKPKGYYEKIDLVDTDANHVDANKVVKALNYANENSDAVVVNFQVHGGRNDKFESFAVTPTKAMKDFTFRRSLSKVKNLFVFSGSCFSGGGIRPGRNDYPNNIPPTDGNDAQQNYMYVVADGANSAGWFLSRSGFQQILLAKLFKNTTYTNQQIAYNFNSIVEQARSAIFRNVSTLVNSIYDAALENFKNYSVLKHNVYSLWLDEELAIRQDLLENGKRLFLDPNNCSYHSIVNYILLILFPLTQAKKWHKFQTNADVFEVAVTSFNADLNSSDTVLQQMLSSGDKQKYIDTVLKYLINTEINDEFFNQIMYIDGKWQYPNPNNEDVSEFHAAQMKKIYEAFVKFIYDTSSYFKQNILPMLQPEFTNIALPKLNNLSVWITSLIIFFLTDWPKAGFLGNSNGFSSKKFLTW